MYFKKMREDIKVKQKIIYSEDITVKTLDAVVQKIVNSNLFIKRKQPLKGK